MENPYSSAETTLHPYSYLPEGIRPEAMVFSDAKLPLGYYLHRLPTTSLVTRWAVVHNGEQVAIADTSHAAELASSVAQVTAEAIDILRTKAHAHANDQAHSIGAATP